MKKVCIINGSLAYVRMWMEMGYRVVDRRDEADVLCFTGGEDVTPSLYGDSKHPTTGNSVYRDTHEAQAFEQAKEAGIPMVGICRGGQFLNVMNGGRMYQHVSKHGMSHNLLDVATGEIVYVSSTHHQMMMPQGDYILVATAHLGGSREWFDCNVARRDISPEDNEVVYYPLSRSLCFQPHPEFTGADYVGMRRYFSRLVEQYIWEREYV